MSKSIWLFYRIDWTSATQAELAIGNPIVWLFGQLAIIALLLKRLFRWREFGKFRDAFLVSGYCAALLPWLFLGGRGFLYYMLPAVPFMALSLAFWFDRYWNRKIWRIAGVILLILSIVFFLYFYPILAAIPISPESYFGGFWPILTDWYPLPILSP
ncbi:MAG: hypothetical protein NTU59_10080 [Coprothermobacterota bacterium]|nr:hypothetical protein [Coprothermobacterota bacterium]